MAGFIYDIWSIHNIMEYAEESSIAVYRGVASEFLILIVLLLSGMFVLYRKTDWMLVKEKNIIAVTLLLSVLLGGFAIFSVLKKSNQTLLEDTVNTVNILPYRYNQDRQGDILNQMEEKNLFVGKVVDIKDRSYFHNILFL